MKKRSMFIVFCLAVLMILMVNTALAGCWVSDSCGGGAVTQVKLSNQDFGTENMYWLNLEVSASTTQVKYIVKFRSDGILKDLVIRTSGFGGWNGTSCLPFGVPHFGSYPILGRATYIAKSNLEVCTYFLT